MTVFLWRPPRTAGTSVTQGLTDLGVVAASMHGRIVQGGSAPLGPGDYVACKHYPPADIVQHRLFTANDIFEGTNLICVRNVWDRLVSTFALLRTTGWRHPGQERWRKATGDQFGEYIEWATSPVRETGYHERNYQCQPATDWLFLDGQRVPFHTVGRFERLDDYWQAVCEVLGVRGKLPLTNCRKHKPYWEYYTPKLAAKVARFYAAEIKEFGYAWDR